MTKSTLNLLVSTALIGVHHNYTELCHQSSAKQLGDLLQLETECCSVSGNCMGMVMITCILKLDQMKN